MNVAVILAGGRGQRMGGDVPKQFMEVNGKPIIIHTLDVFENHPLIDAIIVVCLEQWTDKVHTMVDIYNINKVAKIIEGGDNVQQSICYGLKAAKEWCVQKAEGKTQVTDDCMVVIHDSVRPVINENLITTNIENARIYGNSITVAPPTETFIIEENGKHRLFPRKQVHIVRAPQVFPLNEILKLHEQAAHDGRLDYSDCCSLMCEYGIPFHETMGESTNIKITYPEDIILFQSLISRYER